MFEQFRNKGITETLSPAVEEGMSEITAPVRYRLLKGAGEFQVNVDRSGVEEGILEVWSVAADPVINYYKALSQGEKPGALHDLMTSEGENIGTSTQSIPRYDHIVMVRRPYSTERWQDAAPRSLISPSLGQAIWTTDMIVSPVTPEDRKGALQASSGKYAVLPTTTTLSGEPIAIPIKIAGEGCANVNVGANTIQTGRYPEKLGEHWDLSIEKIPDGSYMLTSNLDPIPVRNASGGSTHTIKQRPTHIWKQLKNGDYELHARLVTPEQLSWKVLLAENGFPQMDLGDNLALLVVKGIITNEMAHNIASAAPQTAWTEFQHILDRQINSPANNMLSNSQLAYYSPSQTGISATVEPGAQYVITNGAGGDFTRSLLRVSIDETRSGLLRVNLVGADPGKEASTRFGTQVHYGFVPVQPVEQRGKVTQEATSAMLMQRQARPVYENRD